MRELGLADRYTLQLDSLHLVGGNREVRFNPGFSVVTGPIASGKTTLVKLIRAMLGRVPADLPPETGDILSVRGRVHFASETWVIDRPLVTTQNSIVSLSRRENTGSGREIGSDDALPDRILDALRLPALVKTASEQHTYQIWILNKLGLPEVSVPSARTRVTSAPTPVTINDWLGYCIIKDEDLDTSVFGHKNQFHDRKRRAVFELIYGIYDSEVAKLTAALRSTELRRDDIDRTTAAVRAFLQKTPLLSLEEIDCQIKAIRSKLTDLDQTSAQLAVAAHEESASLNLRRQIAEAEAVLSEQERQLNAARKNLGDLRKLDATLKAQSRRLIRAIVAKEWLVDFDFIVCPRCGTGIDASRTEQHLCYLCLQEPQQGDFHGGLIKEQERIASQSIETQELITNRSDEVSTGERRLEQDRCKLDILNEELHRRTAAFVSAHSDTMISYARNKARLQADLLRLNEYRELFRQLNDRDGSRAQLEEEHSNLIDALARRAARSERSERLIEDLEARLLTYLQRLNVVLSDLPLTASINRTTYLPEVSNRPFDKLSSQGLTVLVNVAHTLAHHTIAIDHGLPLPGILVLDGLSSNVGHEGFDRERRDDTYRLLMDEAARYQGRLQVIALANDVPSFARKSIVLTLTPEHRLVQT